MRRIIRNRKLTPEESAKYRQIREAVDSELSELVARHHSRVEITADDDIVRSRSVEEEVLGVIDELKGRTVGERKAIKKKQQRKA